jgi:hypothetical protein
LKRLAPFAAAFSAYTILAVILTFPLVAHLSSVVPHDAGDPILNAWILGWNAHQVPMSHAWWNAPIFFPARGAMAFSEHLLGISLFATPIQWLGGSPLFAYNVIFLLSFPVSAFAAHLLVYSLTRRHDAAILAGLAFGFSPYRIAHTPHLQILVACWMPVALLALHTYARTRRIRWLVLFGAAWLLQALSNGYFMLFFSVLVGLWLLWFLPPWREPRAFLATIAAWAVAAVPLLPLLMGYRAIQQSFGMSRGIGEIEVFSADVTSVLDSSPLLAFWRFPPSLHRPEVEMFFGLTVVVCVTAGVVWAWARRTVPAGPAGSPSPRSGNWRWLRAGLWAAVAISALVAASVLAFGPWQVRVLGQPLSVARLHKPLSIFFLGLLGLILGSSLVRTSYARASVPGFYTLGAAVMWLFCLGPTVRLLDTRIWYKAPYAWLMLLPGFDAVRVPARFAMLVVLCLSVAAGLVVARLAPRGRPWRLVLVGMLAAGVVADGWISQLPLLPVPTPGTILGTASIDVPVLEVPLCDVNHDVAAQYRGLLGGYPVVNGYSGYRPRHYDVLCAGLNAHDAQLLVELASQGGALHLIVSDRFESNLAWGPLLAGHAGIERVRSEGGDTLWRVSGVRRRAPSLGDPLPIRRVTTVPAGSGAEFLTDSDRRSYWSSDTPQQGSEEVLIDLGTAREVQAVRLGIGPPAWGFPRHLVVELSLDGQQWTSGWDGPTAASAFAAAVEDPITTPLTVDTGGRMARYVRLRQTGRDEKHAWSIADLVVFSPPSGTAAHRE